MSSFYRRLTFLNLAYISRLNNIKPYHRYYGLAASSTGGGSTSNQSAWTGSSTNQSASTTGSSTNQYSESPSTSTNPQERGQQERGQQERGQKDRGQQERGTREGQDVEVSTSSGGRGNRDLVSHKGGGRGIKRRSKDWFGSSDPIERMMNEVFSLTPFFGGRRNNPFLDIDRFFNAPENVEASFDWVPKIDVRETDNAYVVHAELPGMKKEDIKVSLKDGVLTLSGERNIEDKKDNGEYKRVERSYGSFIRQLTLPEGVDPKSVKAKYDNGILEIEVPKPEQQKKGDKEENISIS